MLGEGDSKEHKPRRGSTGHHAASQRWGPKHVPCTTGMPHSCPHGEGKPWGLHTSVVPGLTYSSATPQLVEQKKAASLYADSPMMERLGARTMGPQCRAAHPHTPDTPSAS